MLEIAKEMILCLNNFESHSYEANEREQKIGYKVLDTIIYNAVQSYNTLFAYYKETFVTEVLSLETLKKNISLNIKCGEFSYADIISKFNYILGVTGTLKTLSPYENKILESYNIKHRTYLPSVFGKKKLKLEKDYIKIADEDSYYKMIRKEIETRIYPDPDDPVDNKLRPVVVFFENNDQIKQFLRS